MITFIIGLIAAIIIYSTLNSRISSIENEIKKLKSGTQANPVKENISSTQSLATEQSILSQTQTPAVPHNIPARPVVSSQPIDEAASGRLLAVIGIIAVFLGLAFFLKYAFDNNIIGITGRIMMGYGVGVLAIILGMSFRNRYKDYADTLTGGGVAVLYLTTFAAYAFYSLFSNFSAFFILIIITALAVGISTFLGSEAIAILGLIGAYGTPIIMSLYKVDPFSLFGYLLIINAGNAVIAYWYKWNKLNFVGIIGTFILSFSWYTFGQNGMGLVEADKIVVFLFSSLYFLIYLITGTLHHVVRKESSDDIDAISISLNGLLYAAFGYTLLNPLYPNSMGLFMFVIAVVYGIVALISFETNKSDKLMNATLPAMAAFFITIAIPIQFHGSTIAVAWFIEAFLMFVIEYIIRGKYLYIYGTIAYMLGFFNLFVFHLTLKTPLSDFIPIFNGRFLLFAFAALIGFFMAYIASLESKREKHEIADGVKIILAIMAEIIGLVILTLETGSYFDREALSNGGADLLNMKNTSISIVWVLYASLLSAIGFIGKYRSLRYGGFMLFLLTAFKIFIDLWSFGALYRIVASIVFGVLALLASFAYSKFKDRLFVE